MQSEVSVISGHACHLGEGPSFDPHTRTLWWFDIAERRLFEHDLQEGSSKIHELPRMASALARIDAGRQLLAMEDGLYVRDVKSGSLTLHVPLEADNDATRSNDGRVHPSGALWIGTMGKRAEPRAGAIYWYRAGELRTLYRNITIPNSICFSPDGRAAYFTDTTTSRLMRVSCDPLTGLPVGEPQLFFDNSGQEGWLDGSVMDADGNLWNARWGAGSLDRITPDGRRDLSFAIPATQASCPAFIPGGFAVTSAWEGMGNEQRKADPKAGFTFKVMADIRPKWEPDAVIG
jgi:sugar lactone lactonase YvrE